MPNAPVDSEVVTITPNIQAISPDGETMQIAVPDVTVTVPVLSMTVSEPEGDTVNATYDNSPIPIMGQVNNYDGEIAVFINDSRSMWTAPDCSDSYTPQQIHPRSRRRRRLPTRPPRPRTLRRRTPRRREPTASPSTTPTPRPRHTAAADETAVRKPRDAIAKTPGRTENHHH